MNQMKTALFDFDGVIVDTEPIYDTYWNEASFRYGLGIDNFATLIKGTTLPHLIKEHFSNYSDAFRQQVMEESVAYESAMPLPLMPGSLEFLHLLKAQGVKMGLVTSSDNAKVQRAFALHGMEGLFDTVVTADRISEGKPNPMCYLLAASDLHVEPQDCLVFEDSFVGIAAGTAAGMRVIGLSTTNSEASLRDKVYRVVPNFTNTTFQEFLSW